MKNIKKFKKAAVLGLAVITTMIMASCGTEGIYYEVSMNPEEPYTLELSKDTITDNDYGDVYDYTEDENGMLNMTYGGIYAGSIYIDKYEGYDCIFDSEYKYPIYCKSKKGAAKVCEKINEEKEAIQKAKEEEQAKIEAESKKKMIAAQKEVFRTLPDTEWVGTVMPVNFYDIDIDMKISGNRIDLNISNYDEVIPSNNYTFTVSGRYKYNSDLDSHNKLEGQILFIPDKVVVNGVERSPEDVYGCISLNRTKQFTEDTPEYNEEVLTFKLSIPTYEDTSRIMSNNYMINMNKK